MAGDVQSAGAEVSYMKRMQVWFTPGHSSVSIVHDTDVTKETSASTMQDVLSNMGSEEQDMLRRFAQGVIECLSGDCKRLREW